MNYKATFPQMVIPTIVVLTSIIGGMSTQSLATPIATPVFSTFDSDCDGWTGNMTGLCDQDGTPSVGVSWTTAGDLLFNEGSSVEAPDTTIVAPAKFLGDWSALDGVGSIQFDHMIVNSGVNNGHSARYIYLLGGGSEASWSAPIPGGNHLSTPWETFIAPLTESDWSVTGSWTDLLANVESVQIQIDFYSSFVGSAEMSRFDNVRLNAVPEPSSILLIGSVLVGLIGARRKVAR